MANRERTNPAFRISTNRCVVRKPKYGLREATAIRGFSIEIDGHNDHTTSGVPIWLEFAVTSIGQLDLSGRMPG
jgi:hypothetical protein